MAVGPVGAASDAALDALFVPFASGALAWPAHGRVLFLRARSGAWAHTLASDGLAAEALVCEQTFKPFADALQRDGLRVSEAAADDTFPLVLVLPPRQRDEARTLLARAVRHAAPGGVVVASIANNAGARSGEADLVRLAGAVGSLSKHKCRVFWTDPHAAAIDHDLLAAWTALDAPRPIADGRYLSRVGLFAWDRIDPASALLVAHLPTTLHGRVADLGAGYGYLAAEVLARCPRVTALDLYEAEARALDVARCNLDAVAKSRTEAIELDFLWHDVTTGLPRRYDAIVTNPPFHQGRADQPELGRAFIAAAAEALRPGGQLWLVANRHLPYEETLATRFSGVRTVVVRDGFKVIEATLSQRAGARAREARA